MRFVGIDLAWKPTHSSGLTVLAEDGRVVDEAVLLDDADIATFVERHDGGGAVLAIDAPLILRQGGVAPRRCELQLQRKYGGRHAGPYSSSFERLGGSRAMTIVTSLSANYRTTAMEPRGARGWWAVEVFPHPTILELGGLERALKYKKGAVQQRRVGLRQLYAIVKSLAAGDPPLQIKPDGRLATSYAVLDELRGSALKRFEDLADAHICAMTALWWWTHGRRGVDVYGDPASGEILVARRVAETVLEHNAPEAGA